MSESQQKFSDAMRELALGSPLVSSKDILKVLDGDYSPLEEVRWLNERCEKCDHPRKSHNGYGGMARIPHCQIIGRKRLTYRQERAGKDDTRYCECGIYYKNVVAKQPVAS